VRTTGTRRNETLRILVVEDDIRIATPVATALRRQKHIVDVALEGEAALHLGEVHPHDMVILDIMLPGIDGFEVCRSLRAGGSQAMILMMTARDGVRDKVRALDDGADDYVVKPFAMPELLARVRALQRRATEGRLSVLAHGQLAFDQATGAFSYREQRLELTRSEHAILELMVRSPRRVFSSEHFYERIASIDQRGTPSTVKTHIANIRKKLRSAGGSADAIVSVYGFGYRLADA